MLRCYYFGEKWENVFQKTIATCHRGFDNNGGAQMRWDSGGRNWIVYLSSLGATKVAYRETEKRVILELDESASRRQLKTTAKRWTLFSAPSPIFVFLWMCVSSPLVIFFLFFISNVLKAPGRWQHDYFPPKFLRIWQVYLLLAGFKQNRVSRLTPAVVQQHRFQNFFN